MVHWFHPRVTNPSFMVRVLACSVLCRYVSTEIDSRGARFLERPLGDVNGDPVLPLRYFAMVR